MHVPAPSHSIRMTFFIVIAALLAIPAGEAASESGFRSSIPNGTLNTSNSRGDGCGHCHVTPNTTSLNAFGSRWKQIGWGALLAGEDSDGDDVPNGWELGDPEGTWSNGQPSPGDPTLITSPGQSGSVPPVLSVSPLAIDHVEQQGQNLSETFLVENVGGDCFGNPSGACTLLYDVATSEPWMTFFPEFGELAPGESESVDIDFDTGAVLGEVVGSAFVDAGNVFDAPQEVVVTLTVPEPSATTAQAAATSLLAGLVICGWRPARAQRPSAGPQS